MTIETTLSFTDGEKALSVGINGPLSDQWAGWSQLSGCLQEADEALKSLLEMGDGQENLFMKKTLWFFAVVQYGKAFQNNEGWGGVKLDANVTLGIEGRAMKEGHVEWMESRNGFVAHGGKSGAHGFQTSVLVRSGSPKRIEQLNALIYSAVTPHLSAVRKMRRAIDIHQKWISDHKKVIERKIFVEMLGMGFELSEAQAELFKIRSDERDR